MEEIVDDTRGGFNSFLDDHRDGEGEATVTLYDFNTTVNQVYEWYPIVEAQELTEENYTPSGRTALFDALTRAIDETAEYISELDSEQQPDNVVVVVLTDGKENASETSQDVVKSRVEHRQETSDWEFMFIGANQDAALTAEGMGIERQNSLDMTHNAEGTRNAYKSTSEIVNDVRTEGTTSGFDEEDRKRQEESEK
jgi:uncharacterized protein YegL